MNILNRSTTPEAVFRAWIGIQIPRSMIEFQPSTIPFRQSEYMQNRNVINELGVLFASCENWLAGCHSLVLQLDA